MKNEKLIIFVFLINIFLACNKNQNPELTIISGIVHSPDSKKVYLSKIDHFDYMNNGYIIDSSNISKDGNFKFEPHNLSSTLVTITTEAFQPFTLQILNNAPQTYYFGNCEKFFTAIPTFYIEENTKINFEWFNNSNIDSIANLGNSKSATRQIKLREFYLNSKKIESSKLDFDQPNEIDENWKQLLKEREHDILTANLEQIDSEYSLDNYIYTEIYLGSLNYFLNWMEQYHPEEVKFAIQNPEKNTIYSKIFSNYKNHDWNPKSFEYYKFTERYVNYNMNIQSETFKNYHEPSKNKYEIAEQVLKGENKKRYLILMQKELKNVL